MTKPGGARKPNNAGYITSKPLASGELRYHARLRNKFLGSFETRREAQKAIEAERDRLHRVPPQQHTQPEESTHGNE